MGVNALAKGKRGSSLPQSFDSLPGGRLFPRNNPCSKSLRENLKATISTPLFFHDITMNDLPFSTYKIANLAEELCSLYSILWRPSHYKVITSAIVPLNQIEHDGVPIFA